jgi:hypothetical protein
MSKLEVKFEKSVHQCRRRRRRRGSDAPCTASIKVFCFPLLSSSFLPH